jgi:YVTN family beta-propeller protein
MLTTLLCAAVARQVLAAATGTIIASNMNAHSVSIVDVATTRTIATLQTGEGPHEVAVSHDGRRAVVSIYGNRNAIGSSLMLIDLGAPTAAPKIIELGAGNQRPHGLAFLPGDKQLLVTVSTPALLWISSGAIDSSMITVSRHAWCVVARRHARLPPTSRRERPRG